MPILPSVSQIERPIPRPAGTVVTAQPVPSGIEEGRSLEYAGAQVNQFAQVLEREQERIDANRAEEAFNKLRMQQIDLTSGDNGFSTKMGSNAVGRPLVKEYGTRFDDAAGTISKDLSNERQRTYFTKRAEVARLQFNADIVRHQQQQATVLARQVFKSTLDIENQNAVARWNDPEALNLSLTRIEAAVRNEADREGWDKQTTDAVLLGERSKVHQAVIGQALATGNVVFANDYFKRNREQIDLQTARATEHAVVDAEQKQLANGYRSNFIASRDSIPLLRKLEEQVGSDKTLSEDRKNALLGPIASRIDVLTNRAEMQYDRKVRALQGQLTKLDHMTLQGFEISPEQALQVLSATKGTELEPQAQQLIQTAAATRAFRTAPPAQQDAMINKLEANIRENPSPERVELLNKFKTISDNQRKLIVESPISYAYQQGLAPQVQIDFSDPKSSSEQILARVETARGMQTRYAAPLKPLLPSEVTMIKSALEKANPDQKLEWFASLRQSTGGDAGAYSAMMGQLAPDDPVTAWAGEAAGRGRTEGARLILGGQALIRPNKNTDGTPQFGKTWPMPPDQQLRQQFQSYERDAFAGSADFRNAAYQATVAAYAKLSETEGDTSEAVNSGRFEKAMKAAVGNIAKHNGKGTLLPYGMDYGQFKDGLNLRINDVALSGNLAPGMTASKLKDMAVQPIGDGRYVFTSGNGYLVDKNGKRVVVNFNVEPTTVKEVPVVSTYLENPSLGF